MSLLRLIRLEAFRHPLALLLLGLLTAVGAGGVNAALAIGEHLADTARLALTGSAGERRIEVRPPDPDNEAGMSFQRALLDAEDLAFLRGLDGLEELRVVRNVPLPATLRVRMPPIIDTEQFLALYALSAEDVPGEHRERWQSDEDPVPLLFNPRVVTLYNFGLADRYHMPRLSAEAMLGLGVQLIVGADRFRRISGAFQTKASVVGYSADVSLWGVGVPRRIAERWLRQLHGELPESYGPISATCRFADSASLTAARAAIAERGLVLDREGELAAAVTRAQRAARLAILALLTLLGAVLVCGAAALTAAVCAERRRALARYRSHGAGLRQLLPGFGGGLLLAAVLGALAGSGLAALSIEPLSQQLDAVLLGPPDERSLPAPPAPGIGAVQILVAGLAAPLLVLLACTPVIAAARRRALLGELRQG